MSCERCGKPEGLCVCESLSTLRLPRKVLVLQHPQEPREALGTAGLLAAMGDDVTLRVGLSWPNLKAALGAEGEVRPARWAVLYLGSGLNGAVPDDANALVLVDKGGKPLAQQAELRDQLDGIVLLDGTWSQAKALWWRNPWVLKCKRAVLRPSRPGLYGKLRREPRREAVSTLEAAAEALGALGADDALRAELLRPMHALLGKIRAQSKPAAKAEPSSDAT